MNQHLYDRDICSVWVVSDKIHIEFVGPTEETLFTKEDLLILLETLENTCKVPPIGWVCSREEGHTGPCAARSVDRRFA